MNKHTPGPWRLADNEPDGDGKTQHVHTTVRGTVYCIAGVNKGEQAGESGWLANAHLIAAAPDLLEALKAMTDRWEPDTTGADRRMWEAACAAIAKAEGA